MKRCAMVGMVLIVIGAAGCAHQANDRPPAPNFEGRLYELPKPQAQRIADFLGVKLRITRP